jgi:hypothetical protein
MNYNLKRMLLLQAVQSIPTIRVTVQAPPGMPFWETTIISALVGTFFGIATSIGMEFVKPAISNRLLKKTVLNQLDTEFRENYAALLDAGDIISQYAEADDDLRQDIEKVIREIGATAMTTERFTYYRDKEKATFYDADEGYRLAKFYLLVERGFKAFPNNDLLSLALTFGREHARLRGMDNIEPLRMFSNTLSAIR